ncbi:PAAR-like protein [Clostridium sp. E02]|uniref:PAAR-like protein n=1 Tax=Clostridium sp. E02 TaxID=2487134 RepID=UPI000F5257D6|nr:PAAR-like protein [Clostridium sp. E02]
MGFFDWMFGKKEEKPPEPLVLGAELRCPYGDHDSYLYVDSGGIDVNNLPKACVEDCKAFHNIQSFGYCKEGGFCEDSMNLAEKWENPEPQGEKINGKEIITTKSLLSCKTCGMEFKIINSGQDGIFAKQILLIQEMDKNYPGLRELLDNPYGSLYLNEGKYEMAIQFIEDRMNKSGGKIALSTLYNDNNLEGEYIKGALGRLIMQCDTGSTETLSNGIVNTFSNNDKIGNNDINSLVINKEFINQLKIVCKDAEKEIATVPSKRWQEKNKLFLSVAAEVVTNFAYGAVLYYSAIGGSARNTQSKANEPSVKQRNTRRSGTKGTGKTNYDNIKFDSLSGDDLTKVTTDIRNNGGSPIDIPENTRVIAQSKNGYQQVKYKWSDGSYSYEARWHTETPGAVQYDRGTTWVVTKTTPGNANGVQKVVEVKVGGAWVNESTWNQAVKANQTGTATEAQKQMLQNGHYLAK